MRRAVLSIDDEIPDVCFPDCLWGKEHDEVRLLRVQYLLFLGSNWYKRKRNKPLYAIVKLQNLINAIVS
jgi:hypothetical protein